MDIAAIFQSLIVIKTAILFTIAMYAVFTFVIFSQVRILNRIISQSSSPLLKLISIIHTILAISLFLAALAIL